MPTMAATRTEASGWHLLGRESPGGQGRGRGFLRQEGELGSFLFYLFFLVFFFFVFFFFFMIFLCVCVCVVVFFCFLFVFLAIPQGHSCHSANRNRQDMRQNYLMNTHND